MHRYSRIMSRPNWCVRERFAHVSVEQRSLSVGDRNRIWRKSKKKKNDRRERKTSALKHKYKCNSTNAHRSIWGWTSERMSNQRVNFSHLFSFCMRQHIFVQFFFLQFDSKWWSSNRKKKKYNQNNWKRCESETERIEAAKRERREEKIWTSLHSTVSSSDTPRKSVWTELSVRMVSWSLKYIQNNKEKKRSEKKTSRNSCCVFFIFLLSYFFFFYFIKIRRKEKNILGRYKFRLLFCSIACSFRCVFIISL